MSLYAIGDLQGCLNPLKELLELIEFDRARDELWLTGDLVSRGPDSLESLRFLKSLGACVRCVLGNHDFHLLRADAGCEPPPADGTLDAILQSLDRGELIEWLRQHPLFIVDHERRLAMVHAGLVPAWGFETAAALANEIETRLRADDYRKFLENIYGNTPERWDENLSGDDRARAIINAMTRLRFCSADGRMTFKYKREPGTQPSGFHPWFETPHRRDPQYTVIFGHWSALGFARRDSVISLDTGCVWGRSLTAFRLDPGREKRFSVRCGKGFVPRSEWKG